VEPSFAQSRAQGMISNQKPFPNPVREESKISHPLLQFMSCLTLEKPNSIASAQSMLFEALRYGTGYRDQRLLV